MGFRNAGRCLAAVAVAAAVVAPAVGGSAAPAGAASSVIISEVAPWGSGTVAYGADWFELTNTGASAVNITGWKMDDNSNSSSLAVALNGVTSIAAGQSVIFIEGTASTATAFTTAWFGASPPSGFTIGSYSGSGVGLSTTSDAVNIYDASNALVTNVTFGASDATPPLQSFDNAAGLTGAITLLSTTGTNGAFVASGDANEIGSPGTITNSGTSVPEAPYLILLPAGALAALGGFVLLNRRRRAAA